MFRRTMNEVNDLCSNKNPGSSLILSSHSSTTHKLHDVLCVMSTLQKCLPSKDDSLVCSPTDGVLMIYPSIHQGTFLLLSNYCLLSQSLPTIVEVQTSLQMQLEDAFMLLCTSLGWIISRKESRPFQ